MNTAPAETMTGRAPSLYEAVAALERHFGGAFVHSRARWGTADGVISYHAVHGYAEQRRVQLAEERLHLVRAAVMGRGGKEAEQMAKADERVAHGIA